MVEEEQSSGEPGGSGNGDGVRSSLGRAVRHPVVVGNEIDSRAPRPQDLNLSFGQRKGFEARGLFWRD